jgi:hypothetical protein
MLILQLFALLLLTGSACSKDLLVGAFNIQIFGLNKVKKTDVMDALVKVKVLKIIKTNLSLTHSVRRHSLNGRLGRLDAY